MQNPNPNVAKTTYWWKCLIRKSYVELGNSPIRPNIISMWGVLTWLTILSQCCERISIELRPFSMSLYTGRVQVRQVEMAGAWQHTGPRAPYRIR